VGEEEEAEVEEVGVEGEASEERVFLSLRTLDRTTEPQEVRGRCTESLIGFCCCAQTPTLSDASKRSMNTNH
jgi:hypothetical protein